MTRCPWGWSAAWCLGKKTGDGLSAGRASGVMSREGASGGMPQGYAGEGRPQGEPAAVFLMGRGTVEVSQDGRALSCLGSGPAACGLGGALG